MPTTAGAKQDARTIALLKEEYLDFYSECPKQGLAAAYILRDTDTITRWKKEDPDFAAKILQAEAKFARKELKKTSAEWKMARLFPNEFREPEKTVNLREIKPILGGTSVSGDEGDEEDKEA